MGKVYEQLTPELTDWLGQQRLFFVATAPLAAEGLLNCSPKGMDTFRVIGPNEVAYLDLTGSGIETTAHLKENGRIVFMFCAFSGPPKIVRLHGTGEVISAQSAAFNELRHLFPGYPGARAIIRTRVQRISDSCGYAIPHFDYVEERDTLNRWAEAKGPEGIETYWAEKNARSVDGLPGIAPENS